MSRAVIEPRPSDRLLFRDIMGLSFDKSQKSVPFTYYIERGKSAVAELEPLMDRIGEIDLYLT